VLPFVQHAPSCSDGRHDVLKAACSGEERPYASCATCSRLTSGNLPVRLIAVRPTARRRPACRTSANKRPEGAGPRPADRLLASGRRASAARRGAERRRATPGEPDKGAAELASAVSRAHAPTLTGGRAPPEPTRMRRRATPRELAKTGGCSPAKAGGSGALETSFRVQRNEGRIKRQRRIRPVAVQLRRAMGLQWPTAAMVNAKVGAKAAQSFAPRRWLHGESTYRGVTHVSPRNELTNR
jgi:hypothetical protein